MIWGSFLSYYDCICCNDNNGNDNSKNNNDWKGESVCDYNFRLVSDDGLEFRMACWVA